MPPTQAHLVLLLVSCLAPAAFFLLFAVSRDRREPEPPSHVLFAFALGALGAVLVTGAYDLLDRWTIVRPIGLLATKPAAEQAAISFLVVAPLEELAKFVPLFLFLRVSRIVDEPLDGLVYASASAVGFALAESWLLTLEADEPLWLVAAVLPFLHVVFSGFWGYALGLGWLEPRRASWHLAGGLGLAIAFHGLYDYLLFDEALPHWLSLPLVVVLWAWLSVATRHAERLSPFPPPLPGVRPGRLGRDR